MINSHRRSLGSRRYPLPFEIQPEWNGLKYYQAYAVNPDSTLYHQAIERILDRKPADFHRASFCYREVYESNSGHTRNLSQYEMGYAAAYKTYITWINNNVLEKNTTLPPDRLQDAFVAFAIAEVSHIFPSDQEYREQLKEACRAAAATARSFFINYLKPKAYHSDARTRQGDSPHVDSHSSSSGQSSNSNPSVHSPYHPVQPTVHYPTQTPIVPQYYPTASSYVPGASPYIPSVPPHTPGISPYPYYNVVPQHPGSSIHPGGVYGAPVCPPYATLAPPVPCYHGYPSQPVPFQCYPPYTYCFISATPMDTTHVGTKYYTERSRSRDESRSRHRSRSRRRSRSRHRSRSRRRSSRRRSTLCG